MGALIDHAAPVYYHDLVRILDGRKAVRDDDGGPSGPKPRQRLGDQTLGCGIKGAGRFVQQKDRCIAQQGAGNGDPLPLTARQG